MRQKRLLVFNNFTELFMNTKPQKNMTQFSSCKIKNNCLIRPGHSDPDSGNQCEHTSHSVVNGRTGKLSEKTYLIWYMFLL